jgi:hypothetical protein
MSEKIEKMEKDWSKEVASALDVTSDLAKVIQALT